MEGISMVLLGWYADPMATKISLRDSRLRFQADSGPRWFSYIEHKLVRYMLVAITENELILIWRKPLDRTM